MFEQYVKVAIYNARKIVAHAELYHLHMVYYTVLRQRSRPFCGRPNPFIVACLRLHVPGESKGRFIRILAVDGALERFWQVIEILSYPNLAMPDSLT